MLTPFRPTMDEDGLEDYTERLRRLLQYAGVLETVLCRMCSFLPSYVVRTVIAIVRRNSLIAPTFPLTLCRSALFIVSGTSSKRAHVSWTMLASSLTLQP